MSKTRNNTATIPPPPTSEIYVAGYLLSSNKGLSDLTKRLETVQLALRQFGQTRETSTAPAGLDNIASSLVNDSIIRSKSPVCTYIYITLLFTLLLTLYLLSLYSPFTLPLSLLSFLSFL